MKDPPYDKKTAPGGNQGAAKTNQTRPDNTARPGDGKRVFDPATLDAMRHRLHDKGGEPVVMCRSEAFLSIIARSS